MSSIFILRFAPIAAAEEETASFMAVISSAILLSESVRVGYIFCRKYGKYVFRGGKFQSAGGRLGYVSGNINAADVSECS